MARRGAELREHILDEAKWAFLESGFERTSMDAVAARAQTSKRSLYAHFPTKDALFLAVVDRMHELFRGRLLTPGHYAEEPAEAAALFCGRFLQMLGYAPILRTCRLGITEAERLPAAAARLHEVFFGTATARLAAYLCGQYGLDAAAGGTVAARLLGMTVYPALTRALFGLGQLRDDLPDEAAIESDVDMAAIRQATRLTLPEPAVPEPAVPEPAVPELALPGLTLPERMRP